MSPLVRGGLVLVVLTVVVAGGVPKAPEPGPSMFSLPTQEILVVELPPAGTVLVPGAEGGPVALPWRAVDSTPDTAGSRVAWCVRGPDGALRPVGVPAGLTPWISQLALRTERRFLRG